MSDDAAAAERATKAYEAALERFGAADMRPNYRHLLLRLKEDDAAGYEAAVSRYEEEVVPRTAADGDDALAVWFEYGRWLAGRLEAGRVVCIDPTGLATESAGEENADQLRADRVILHVPDDQRRRAILLAAPRQPTEFQAAALEVLGTAS